MCSCPADRDEVQATTGCSDVQAAQQVWVPDPGCLGYCSQHRLHGLQPELLPAGHPCCLMVLGFLVRTASSVSQGRMRYISALRQRMHAEVLISGGRWTKTIVQVQVFRKE